MKVAITTSSFAKYSEEPLSLLKAHGIEIVMNPYGRTLTEEEAILLLAGCEGVAAGTEPLTAHVLETLPNLRVISRCGTGMDNVDLEAAEKQHIIVCNTPDGPTKAVAELVLGYALSMLRHISSSCENMRSDIWKKKMGYQLFGKKVGIVGFGRIGRATGEIFTSIGCSVAFYDPFVPASGSYTRMSLDELTRWADIITLHCPAQATITPLFDKKRIDAMKHGAWLINAARGGLVDEGALYSAIKSGALSGAALDVYAQEPYQGPLVELPEVILTPHIGSYARESRVSMEIDTIKNLLKALGVDK